jgi:hypothetical protein
MITTEDYFQSYDSGPKRDLRAEYKLDMTPQIEENAKRTIALVNLLLTEFGHRKLNGGWRPPAYNAKTPGAAKNSLHLTAEAADIEDDDGELDDWCMGAVGEAALVRLGLWHEHPSCTMAKNGRGAQCHVQIRPPRSGNRHYYR